MWMIGCRESDRQRIIVAIRDRGHQVRAWFRQTHPAHRPALRNRLGKETNINHTRKRLRTSDPSVKTPAQRKVAQHKVLWAEGIGRRHHKMLNLLAQATRRKTDQLGKARGE